MTGLRLTPPTAPAYSFEPEPWMSSAVCTSTDPEAFFPMEGSSPKAAKKVCRGCPVKTECLEYALATDVHWGIWGGTSERDRRVIRRQQAAAA